MYSTDPIELGSIARRYIRLQKDAAQRIADQRVALRDIANRVTTAECRLNICKLLADLSHQTSWHEELACPAIDAVLKLRGEAERVKPLLHEIESMRVFAQDESYFVPSGAVLILPANTKIGCLFVYGGTVNCVEAAQVSWQVPPPKTADRPPSKFPTRTVEIKPKPTTESVNRGLQAAAEAFGGDEPLGNQTDPRMNPQGQVVPPSIDKPPEHYSNNRCGAEAGVPAGDFAGPQVGRREHAADQYPGVAASALREKIAEATRLATERIRAAITAASAQVLHTTERTIEAIIRGYVEDFREAVQTAKQS